MASPAEPGNDGRATIGLRERKKARTRAAIQRHAIALFTRQGYAETTVDQIAEAAEVSPSTFFRYFPTKEAVVVMDAYDAPMLAALRAQPPELAILPAIRAAIKAVFGNISSAQWAEERQRHQLLVTVPELRAALFEEFFTTVGTLTAAVAERSGVPADDFTIRVQTGAIVGALSVATMDVFHQPDLDYNTVVDRCLAVLEAGLPG
ncbi:MAG TPA: TetR family transcriptional regulator [Pseudonocardiaceae bacterium]|nr:TetR family transcriptional regulator [Pseudonocardiaceae bacterium]